MSLSRRTRGRLALVATTFLWGFSFVLVQRALQTVPVFHLLAARFWIGILFIAPLLVRERDLWRRATRPLALAVAACLLIGFLFQTYGLYWTTPARSAFLTGLAVIFVPGVAWLLRAGRPTLPQLAATGLAALGLLVIYGAGTIAGLGGETPPFNRGDALTLCGAVIFSFHLVFIEKALPGSGVVPLTFAQFALIAFVATPSLVLQPIGREEFTGASLFAVIVIGVVCTGAAFLLQLYGQQHLPAIEAGLLLTLEPVFATAASVLLGAEAWSMALGLGGFLVVLGTVVALWPTSSVASSARLQS